VLIITFASFGLLVHSKQAHFVFSIYFYLFLSCGMIFARSKRTGIYQDRVFKQRARWLQTKNTSQMTASASQLVALTYSVHFRRKLPRGVFDSSIASPKFFRWPKDFGGPKCLTLGEQQCFCLGRRFSKNKMTTHAKNFGGMVPWPLVAKPMVLDISSQKSKQKLSIKQKLMNIARFCNFCKFLQLPTAS